MAVSTKRFQLPKYILPRFNPRFLAYVFLGIGIILALVFFNPIAEVFSGHWILQQEFVITDVEHIKQQFPDWQANPFLSFIINNALALGIPALAIRYYSMMVLIGVLSGFFLALYLASRQFIAESLVERLFVGLVVIGILGARLTYVALNYEAFNGNFLDMANLQKGGLSIFGALIFGSLYLMYYCRRYKFNLFEFGDFIAPAVLLGQIFGRFGNFFNYEAYGSPSRNYWKMFVPEPAVLNNHYDVDIFERYYHPTFLYEIIPNFLLLIWLLYNYDKLTIKRSGLVFAQYCIGYGAIRFFTEFFRLDALNIDLPFTIPIISSNHLLFSQLVALALCIYGIVIYRKRRKIIYLKRTMDEVR